MEPQEINRIIAEKVMGWSYDPIGGIGQTCNEPAWILEDNSWILVKTWDPYHSISHAKMALDKLIEQGYWIHLFGRLGKWSCGLAHLTDTHSETLSAAICLALVEAVKADPPQAD